MQTIMRILVTVLITAISFTAIKYLLGYILGIISPTLFNWLWSFVSIAMPWGGRVGLADLVLGLSCLGGALSFTKNM